MITIAIILRWPWRYSITFGLRTIFSLSIFHAIDIIVVLYMY